MQAVEVRGGTSPAAESAGTMGERAARACGRAGGIPPRGRMIQVRGANFSWRRGGEGRRPDPEGRQPCAFARVPRFRRAGEP